MSKDIYFFFIDERPIISFNKDLEEGCGITINDIDLSKVKETISRKIDQNTKWNRKFDKLMKDIKEYERNHNKDLKIDILNRCIKLDILPELKNNNPTTIPN